MDAVRKREGCLSGSTVELEIDGEGGVGSVGGSGCGARPVRRWGILVIVGLAGAGIGSRVLVFVLGKSLAWR